MGKTFETALSPELEQFEQEGLGHDTVARKSQPKRAKGTYKQLENEFKLPPGSAGRVDRRTLRRTGRTLQFATKVSAELLERIDSIADAHGLKIVEVIENAIAAYERELKGR